MMMQEYRLSIFASLDGGFALDVQQLHATGTSPYVKFRSWQKLREFFESLSLSEDLLLQIEAMGECLTPGNVYHQTMYLPSSISEKIVELNALRMLTPAR